MSSKGPIEMPLRYINYAVDKGHINDDVAKAKSWMILLLDVIESMYEGYSNPDHKAMPIDPEGISSDRIYAMLGPFEPYVVDFDISEKSSKCYEAGYRHPEPLSQDDIIELRKHGLVHSRDKILMPSLRKSNNRLVTDKGDLIKGYMSAVKLSTEPIILNVEDRKEVRLGIVADGTKVGNISTFCQRINTLLSNKNINLEKLEQMQKLVGKKVIYLNAVQHELSQLEITVHNEPETDTIYSGDLAYRAYPIIQQVHHTFVSSEFNVKQFNDLFDPMTSLLNDLIKLRSDLERKQFQFKSQTCHISVKDTKYILRCKSMNIETMDKLNIVPIPFVYENKIFQLVHKEYDYTKDHCMVIGNPAKPTKQFRIYLKPECCLQLRQNLAPMACPLQPIISTEMIIDIGDYEILIPDLDGSSFQSNCQGEIQTDSIHENTAVQTECGVQLGTIRVTMTGSKLFKNFQKKLHSWTQALSDREWSLVLLSITFILGSILQCSICYFRSVKRKKRSNTDSDDSASDEDDRAEVRTKARVAVEVVVAFVHIPPDALYDGVQPEG